MFAYIRMKGPDIIHMLFQIFKKIVVCKTCMLYRFCKAACNLPFRKRFPGCNVKIYFFRLIKQTDQICRKRRIHCGFAADRSICGSKKCGCIIDKWNPSCISSGNKSCQICHDTAADSKDAAISAEPFCKHRIFQDFFCLACFAFFSSFKHKQICMKSGLF